MGIKGESIAIRGFLPAGCLRAIFTIITSNSTDRPSGVSFRFGQTTSQQEGVCDTMSMLANMVQVACVNPWQNGPREDQNSPSTRAMHRHYYSWLRAFHLLRWENALDVGTSLARVVDRGFASSWPAVSSPPAELSTFSRVFTTPRNLMDEIQMLQLCCNERLGSKPTTTTRDSRNTDARTPWSVVPVLGRCDTKN